MSEVFIVFVSKYSNSCKAIKQQLDYIAPHFNTKVVDIDNVNIRKSIYNATKYKIESVPSIVLLYPDSGKIQLHEGQQVIDLLNKGVKMVQQKLQAIQEQQRSKARNYEDEAVDDDAGHSDIEALLDDEEEDEPQEPVVDKKRKIGKTTLFPDKKFAPLDEEGMIGNYLPNKDEHSGMEKSSLSTTALSDRHMNYPAQVERQTGGRKVNVKVGKKSTMIEDLSDIPEKPQGMDMSDILDESRGAMRSKETDIKSKAMRERQDNIMAERAAMIEAEDQRIRQARGL
jgi:hypothetical protein